METSGTTAADYKTSSGFRKLRGGLLVQPFKNGRDNIPLIIRVFFLLDQAEVDAVPGLFIGSYGAATNLAALIKAGITHVLCVSPSLSLHALSFGGKVLVHCFMGRSRSATIILAYLITRHGFTLSDALRELRRARPQAQPNTGFHRELIALEAKQKQLREQERA
uniref:protein-tyrosine-phosphatase n=1 Tax=Hyaloperonospora arabidopsidis (strain Emoy2) TaxID=559515 RepID=M4BBR3_HYAAE